MPRGRRGPVWTRAGVDDAGGTFVVQAALVDAAVAVAAGSAGVSVAGGAGDDTGALVADEAGVFVGGVLAGVAWPCVSVQAMVARIKIGKKILRIVLYLFRPMRLGAQAHNSNW